MLDQAFSGEVCCLEDVPTVSPHTSRVNLRARDTLVSIPSKVVYVLRIPMRSSSFLDKYSLVPSIAHFTGIQEMSFAGARQVSGGLSCSSGEQHKPLSTASAMVNMEWYVNLEVVQKGRDFERW